MLIDDADAAGIDDLEAEAVALDLMQQPIAGYSRSWVDNGDGLSDQTVEQTGFADVWTSDDSD
jgi:hypothetical protein